MLGSAQKWLYEIQSQLVNRQMSPTINNFYSLKSVVVQLEYMEQLHKLEDLFKSVSQTDFSSEFLKLCSERALKNDNTCINFAAFPDSPSNQIYWRILMDFLKPSCQSEVIKFIFPAVNCLIVPTFEMRSDKSYVMELKVAELSALKEKVDLYACSAYVVSGKYLIDLNEIARFDLELHKIFRQLIHKNYPDCARRIYEHNQDLKNLSNDLNLVEQDQCYFEVIQHFIGELLLGGSRNTHDIFAAVPAQKAYLDFLEWLKNIADDDKQALLSLSLNNGISIQNVMDKLKANECVETSAGILQHILERNKNVPFLKERRGASCNEYHRVVQKYARGKFIDILHGNRNFNLPEDYLDRAIAYIPVMDADQLLDILYDFPSFMYSKLLRNKLVSGLPKGSAQITAMNYLNEEQVLAFNAVLLENRDKFGNYQDLFVFAVEGKNQPLLLSLIDKLTVPELQLLLTTHDTHSLMHKLVFCPEVLVALSKRIPYAEWLKFLSQTDEDKNTLMHYLANEEHSLRAVLSTLEAADCLKLVSNKNTKGNNVCHLAACSAELSLIFAYFTFEQKLDFLQTVNEAGENLLFFATSHPDTLKQLLELDKQLSHQLIGQVTGSGVYIYMKAAETPGSLEVIYNFFGNDMFCQWLFTRTVSGRHLLYYASNCIESLRLLLPLYTDPLVLINELNERNENLLHQAAETSDCLELLLRVYPDDVSRRNAILLKNNKGQTLLHSAYRHLQACQLILECFPEEARKALVMEQDNDGCNIFYDWILYEPSILKTMLTKFPIEWLKEGLVEENKEGEIVLHAASFNTQSLEVVVNFFQDNAACLQMLKKQNSKTGANIFHLLTVKPSSLKRVLDLCENDEEKMQALQVKDKTGCTPLMYSVNNPQSMKIIVACYSDRKKLLKALNERDIEGNTLLHKALKYIHHFSDALALFPNCKKLEALLAVNHSGESVLETAVKNNLLSDDVFIGRSGIDFFKHSCFEDADKCLSNYCPLVQKLINVMPEPWKDKNIYDELKKYEYKYRALLLVQNELQRLKSIGDDKKANLMLELKEQLIGKHSLRYIDPWKRKCSNLMNSKKRSYTLFHQDEEMKKSDKLFKTNVDDIMKLLAEVKIDPPLRPRVLEF